MADEVRITTVADLVDCARKGEDQPVITTLEQQPNIMKQKNFNNLVKAVVEKGRTDVLVWLLNSGFNKNAALDIAINNGSEKVINLVLDLGADKDEGLYFAIKSNKTKTIAILLARGANINTNKRNGSSPLHVAITLKCDVSVIQYLIDNRADTNARNKNNKTALDLVKHFLAGKIDTATKDNLKEIENLLKLNELNDDIFECLQGLPDGLSGYSYQIKLFTLYAIVNTKLGISADCKYELGTEVKDLVPFDDIYSRITQDGQINCQFVQVKQTKKPEFNKIKESNFFTVLQSGENMKDKIKGNDTIVKMFIKYDEINSNLLKNGESGEFIYCTNTDFDTQSISLFVQKCKDGLLCGVGGIKWQIGDWRYVDIEIKFVLLNLIASSKFITTMDEVSKNDIKKQIKTLNNFKIGNKSIENEENNNLWTISKTAQEGIKAIDKYLELCEKSKVNIKNASNIESVKNNIPDECAPLNYTGELSSIINSAIAKIDEVSKSLKIDKELFVHFIKNDDFALRKKIENFIKLFSIYTVCPTSEQLDDIITKELDHEFKFHKSKLLSFYCVQYFSKWISDFKNKLGNLFKHEDGKKLFFDLRMQIFKGLSKSYTEDLFARNIQFKDENKAVVEFIKNHKNHKILHILTEYPDLYAHKVLQTLKSIENVSGFNSDNILFTSSEFIFKSNDSLKHFFEAFSSNNSDDNLLIMVFSDYCKKDINLYNVLNTLRSITANNRKQIIVIANKDNKLATALKYMFNDNILLCEDKVTFCELTDDTQTHILDKAVNFMNNPNSSEIIKKLKDFMNIKAACEIIDEEMLSMVLHDINNIHIGDDKPFFSDEYNKEYYIPRRIHPQLIHKDVFRYMDNNLFFVTGISESELKSKFNSSNWSIHFWQKDHCFNSGIIIIPESENNITNEDMFALISNSCAKSITWLEFRDELIFLKGIKTNKQNNDAHIYLEVTEMNETQMEKYSFGPDKLDEKIVLLANNAGEGKSTMLTDLSYALKEKRPDLWIVRLDLIDFVDIKMLTSLNNITFGVEETTKAIKTIVRMAISGEDSDVNVKFERILLEISLNGFGNTKVVLLIDGFDEISPDYKEKTIVLLKALKNSNVKQMWITTRIHLKSFLEQELEEAAYFLNPLSAKEQRDFLNKYWKWKLKNHKDEVCETEEQICVQIVNRLKSCYDNYCQHTSRLHTLESLIDIMKKPIDFTLKSLQTIIDENLNLLLYAEESLDEWKRAFHYENEFSKVPLNLKMLAEYLYNNNWQITNLKAMGTFEIYRQFMERKIKIYREHKSTTLSGNPADRELADLASTIIGKLHREVAVKTLFPQSRFLPDLNVTKEYTNSNYIITRLGLIKMYENRLEFVHRSYAEYFFSEYLSIHLENPSVQSEILADVLIQEQYHLVRTFFNGFLSQTESKPCSPKVWKEIIKKQNDRGESIMHIISCGGLNHIRSYVLSNTERQNNTVGTLLRFGELQTDVNTCGDNEEMCDIIMDKIKQYTDVFKENNGQIVLNTAAIVSNKEVLDVIKEIATEYQNTLKLMLMKTNYKGDTALHVAAYNNNIEVCKQIMSMVVNYFDGFENVMFSIDRNGLTALHVAALEKNKEICDIIMDGARQREDIFQKLMSSSDVDRILNNVKKIPNELKDVMKKCEKEVRKGLDQAPKKVQAETERLRKDTKKILKKFRF